MTINKLWLVALVAALPTVAQAHQGSMEDQIACTQDVFRLCSAQVPNENAIVACLERNKPNLSPPCRRVFSDPPAGARNTNGQTDEED